MKRFLKHDRYELDDRSRETAWQGIRHSPRLRAFYDRILRGDAGRRRIALVATAHHMLRAMLAMLQTGELWRYDQKAA